MLRRATTMSRAALLFLLTVAAALVTTACGSPPPAEEARPNFLFLFADDQRADTIGAWGNALIQTPNIDRLADAGFSLRANYNLGGRHGAVCQPSRVMVNTGKSYFRVPDDMGDELLLPELLGEQGYTTFGDRQVAQRTRLLAARLPARHGGLLRRHERSHQGAAAGPAG